MYEIKVVVAVSGVKNSGKTTLITRLLPFLTGYGLRVATIKHDGHEFEGDVPEYIKSELVECARMVSDLDVRMLKLNEEILAITRERGR